MTETTMSEAAGVSTPDPAPADPGAAVAIPRHRFTVGDFARLGEAGIVGRGDDGRP